MKRTLCVCLFLLLAATSLLSQVPFLNQPLVPTNVPPGSPAFALTVYGAGFVPASVVKWNGVALRTTYVSLRELSAEVPGSYLGSAGTVSVTVSNPSPGGGTSNAIPFTITTPTKTVAFATSTIPVGLNPGKVVVADFNGDGKADLAVVNQNQPDTACYTPEYGNVGTISILLGNGDGTFTNRSTLCFPSSSGWVTHAGPQLVAGDFNGDGKTDLAPASVIAEGPSCPLQSSWATETERLQVRARLGSFDGIVWEMISADFNRDGNLDLASPATVLDLHGYFHVLS